MGKRGKEREKAKQQADFGSIKFQCTNCGHILKYLRKHLENQRKYTVMQEPIVDTFINCPNCEEIIRTGKF